MHVNVIARRTITVDGKLDDWKGVLPQTVAAGDAAPTLTEAAWFPFKKFDESVTKGFATGYLAYDDHYFYFAAKVADDTPDAGMVRFATRDDDEYFYPPVVVRLRSSAPSARAATKQAATPGPRACAATPTARTRTCPAATTPTTTTCRSRSTSCRRTQKPCYPNPPGTMPGYIAYQDTDYEYALNQVAAEVRRRHRDLAAQLRRACRRSTSTRASRQSPKDGPVTRRQAGHHPRRQHAPRRARHPLVGDAGGQEAAGRGRDDQVQLPRQRQRAAAGMELSRGRSVAKRNAVVPRRLGRALGERAGVRGGKVTAKSSRLMSGKSWDPSS